MTIHYHGVPITPNEKLAQLAGRHFCVRFGAHSQVERCHEIGQSVMLDNGAFSFWRQGTGTNWPAYYEWCERWLQYPTTWAVIPDVIDGDSDANDRLIQEWPHGQRGAPVWHMHESIARLERLCAEWQRVCIGSSGAYTLNGGNPSRAWRFRIEEALNSICRDGVVPVWLHMLRGMALLTGGYPFASVDSTDIGRNHNRGGGRKRDVAAMAAKWDAVQCAPHWQRRTQLTMEDPA